jgi:hypothetical protein
MKSPESVSSYVQQLLRQDVSQKTKALDPCLANIERASCGVEGACEYFSYRDRELGSSFPILKPRIHGLVTSRSVVGELDSRRFEYPRVSFLSSVIL